MDAMSSRAGLVQLRVNPAASGTRLKFSTKVGRTTGGGVGVPPPPLEPPPPPQAASNRVARIKAGKLARFLMRARRTKLARYLAGLSRVKVCVNKELFIMFWVMFCFMFLFIINELKAP